MQKLHLEQKTKQKLSPQQIQSIALLQLSSDQMQERIIRELEENPVLEQQSPDHEVSDEEMRKLYEHSMNQQLENRQQKSSRSALYKEGYNRPIPNKVSWQDDLLHQLACLSLNANDNLIGKYIIGSLDTDGYMRKSLESVVNDIAFLYGVEITMEKVVEVLHKIQNFDPVGVGARDIQECLSLQLSKRSPAPALPLAKQIVSNHFPLFSKRHYEKIRAKLGNPNLQLFKDALALITKLDPQPLNIEEDKVLATIYPDFIVTIREGKLQVMLAKDQLPALKISKNYAYLLEEQKNIKDADQQEALAFLKKRIMRAHWFIEAINQRKKTLLRTMQAIVELQQAFFQEGKDNELKPIFLRDVADKIAMDVSTVSRVVSKRKVQTDWGIYPLKYFFSEPIDTISGRKVSSRLVKEALAQLIEKENKLNPYSDIVLTKKLRTQGYLVARRTITKYREQLKLPIARFRKSM